MTITLREQKLKNIERIQFSYSWHSNVFLVHANSSDAYVNCEPAFRCTVVYLQNNASENKLQTDPKLFPGMKVLNYLQDSELSFHNKLHCLLITCSN